MRSMRGILRRGGGRACAIHSREDRVFRRVGLETFAALVRDRLRRLEQKQAARGIIQADAAAQRRTW